jgi:hypothetical protein
LVGSETGAVSVGGSLAVDGFPLACPCRSHRNPVSSSRRIARSMRICRTTRSCITSRQGLWRRLSWKVGVCQRATRYSAKSPSVPSSHALLHRFQPKPSRRLARTKWCRIFFSTHPPEWHAASSARGLSCCLRPEREGSASGIIFCRGHHWVHLRYGPVTRSPSRRWLGRSASSVSFPPRMRPKLRRFLTFPPVGLSPTEHASLSWTHSFAKRESALRRDKLPGLRGAGCSTVESR